MGGHARQVPAGQLNAAPDAERAGRAVTPPPNPAALRRAGVRGGAFSGARRPSPRGAGAAGLDGQASAVEAAQRIARNAAVPGVGSYSPDSIRASHS
ncbi:hypothetical protein GCM10017600_77700 [Streptosporangium carneum]|uniref:Uncharacterized protein n=1 Tax=Streptosporangium carneum TaxID=47481 RepID=A0A9W6IA03_9ACTN|nr:hypothetical protein GCM10017600_77700 [Streptosporangium carneum]